VDPKFRSRRAKITHKNEKKLRNSLFHVLSAVNFFLVIKTLDLDWYSTNNAGSGDNESGTETQLEN
jgi:hypothetical protein